MSFRRRRAYVLIGTALIFGVVIWTGYQSERKIAALALALAAMALWWTLLLSTTLDNKVAEIRDDVRRIADAVASRPVFRFRLVNTDGSVRGDAEFAVPNWKPGDTIPIGADEILRVVEVLPPRDSADEGLPILVVEPAEASERPDGEGAVSELEEDIAGAVVAEPPGADGDELPSE